MVRLIFKINNREHLLRPFSISDIDGLSFLNTLKYNNIIERRSGFEEVTLVRFTLHGNNRFKRVHDHDFNQNK